MNLLQRKCFAASTLFHVALVLVLVICAGFRNTEPLVALKFVAPPAEEPGASAPSAPPIPDKRNYENATRPVSSPESHQVPTTIQSSPRHALPQVSTVPGSRQPIPSAKRPEAGDSSASSDFNAHTREVGRAFDKALANLKSGPPTKIPDTHIGQGRPAGSYEEIIKAAYGRGWLPPDGGIASRNGITRVLVTVARDGHIQSARILKRSGEIEMDQSVQRALDSVSRIAPFESGASENERTYTISFNLKVRELE